MEKCTKQGIFYGQFFIITLAFFFGCCETMAFGYFLVVVFLAECQMHHSGFTLYSAQKQIASFLFLFVSAG